MAVELSEIAREWKRIKKDFECAFQTTLSALSRSRVSPRRALRARAATLSEGEESETERGRRRATIRKTALNERNEKERASERALTLWLLHRRQAPRVVSRGACASLEGARVRRGPLGTPEGLDGTLESEFS